MSKGSGTPGGVSVHVKGKNITVTVALREQVIHKMSKLDRYLDHLHDIDVELCTEKTREAGHHNHVEATTRVAGRTIRVEAVDSDMYAAIDAAVDRLYRQLNRRKERMKSHHNPRLAETLPTDEAEDLQELRQTETLDEPGRIVHVERLAVKPQFEDEALDDLDQSGQSFVVFLNAKNEHVNVVYRRSDGSYGLIEPQT